MKVAIFLLASVVFGLAAFQSNTISIGKTTISVPDSNPTVNVTTPSRSGRLVVWEELPSASPTPTASPTPSPSVVTDFRGVITLSNGKGLAQFAGNVSTCVVSDRSGNSTVYQVTTNGLAVQGVGPAIDYWCR